MPVTLLDVKVDVVKKLMEEAERRGVRIKLLLLDRAFFFTTACINLLKDMAVDFITPCVCNERVQGAVDSLGGKEGGGPPLLHPRQRLEEGGLVHHGHLLEQEEGEAHPLRHQRGRGRQEAGQGDTEGVQEALGHRDVVQEGERGLRKDALPFTDDKAGILHDRHDPLQPVAGDKHHSQGRRRRRDDDGGREEEEEERISGHHALHGDNLLRPSQRKNLTGIGLEWR